MKRFFTNKYTLSVLILMAILATDILLHKGMSRVILPEDFTAKRQAQTNLLKCESPVQLNGRQWVKAISSPENVLSLDTSISGFKMDVYFDTTKNAFFIYSRDTFIINSVEDILEINDNRKLNTSVWLDIKNLEEESCHKTAHRLKELENKFQLQQRLITSSDNAAALKTFCDSGFFTSYQVPLFNPYTDSEDELLKRIDSIAAILKKYPVSSLTCHYFQIPFLKKFFPVFPLLTFTDDSKISMVNKLFNYQLDKDKQVYVVLHSIEN